MQREENIHEHQGTPTETFHGARTRSIQAFLTRDLSGPDVGIPDSVRIHRGLDLQADLVGFLLQCIPQRADHLRAPRRNLADEPPGDSTVSRDRVGQRISLGRSWARRCPSAGVAGADGGDRRRPRRAHVDLAADHAWHPRFDRDPARRGARHLPLHDQSLDLSRSTRHLLGIATRSARSAG